MDLKTIEKIDKVYMWNYAIDKKDFYENAAEYRRSRGYALATFSVNFPKYFDKILKEVEMFFYNIVKTILEAEKKHDKRIVKISYLKKKSQRKKWSKWKDKKA